MKTPSISIDQRVIEDFISESGKWQAMGSFHLKFENWDIFKRNRPKVVKGFGGWLRIKNLPLDYWCRKTFEVIGNYFGGLEDIATETLNLITVVRLTFRPNKSYVVSCPPPIQITSIEGTIF